jgi:hypothetical protein
MAGKLGPPPEVLLRLVEVSALRTPLALAGNSNSFCVMRGKEDCESRKTVNVMHIAHILCLYAPIARARGNRCRPSLTSRFPDPEGRESAIKFLCWVCVHLFLRRWDRPPRVTARGANAKRKEQRPLPSPRVGAPKPKRRGPQARASELDWSPLTIQDRLILQ